MGWNGRGRDGRGWEGRKWDGRGGDEMGGRKGRKELLNFHFIFQQTWAEPSNPSKLLINLNNC